MLALSSTPALLDESGADAIDDRAEVSRIAEIDRLVLRLRGGGICCLKQAGNGDSTSENAVIGMQ